MDHEDLVVGLLWTMNIGRGKGRTMTVSGAKPGEVQRVIVEREAETRWAVAFRPGDGMPERAVRRYHNPHKAARALMNLVHED